MRIARGRIGTEAALVLVALALALRLLIAPGFMPVMGAQGFTVSLCTADGPVSVRLPGKAPLDTAHDPCPYAALAMLPLLDAPATLTAGMAPAFAPPAFPPATARPHLGSPAPPPPSTGPPDLG